MKTIARWHFGDEGRPWDTYAAAALSNVPVVFLSDEDRSAMVASVAAIADALLEERRRRDPSFRPGDEEEVT